MAIQQLLAVACSSNSRRGRVLDDGSIRNNAGEPAASTSPLPLFRPWTTSSKSSINFMLYSHSMPPASADTQVKYSSMLLFSMPFTSFFSPSKTSQQWLNESKISGFRFKGTLLCVYEVLHISKQSVPSVRRRFRKRHSKGNYESICGSTF